MTADEEIAQLEKELAEEQARTGPLASSDIIVYNVAHPFVSIGL
jgi:hypothetical protein